LATPPSVPMLKFYYNLHLVTMISGIFLLIYSLISPTSNRLALKIP
jgi:hypothetical protein